MSLDSLLNGHKRVLGQVVEGLSEHLPIPTLQLQLQPPLLDLELRKACGGGKIRELDQL